MQDAPKLCTLHIAATQLSDLTIGKEGRYKFA